MPAIFDLLYREYCCARPRSISALEIAEHILAQAARGERDVERLKASAFQMIAGRLRVNAA